MFSTEVIGVVRSPKKTLCELVAADFRTGENPRLPDTGDEQLVIELDSIASARVSDDGNGSGYPGVETNDLEKPTIGIDDQRPAAASSFEPHTNGFASS
jgi:hypothetical protein